MTKQCTLDVKHLSISLHHKTQSLLAVQNLSFSLYQGFCTGIIGESGCGKSITCQAILGLLNPKKWAISGEITLNHQPIPYQNEQKMCKLRRESIAFIPQNPMSALDPRMTIAQHICEGIPRNKRNAHKNHALTLLSRMNLSSPSHLLQAYPFQLSGGQLQRVLIAIALLSQPSILIADEPTTALDCQSQQEILMILKEVTLEHQLSLLLISHDIQVMEQLSDFLYVMYAGQMMEYGDTKQLLTHPNHPYTQGLLAAKPVSTIKPLPTLQGIHPPLEQWHTSPCPFLTRCPKSHSSCYLLPETYQNRCSQVVHL